jgi:hypothetical protein
MACSKRMEETLVKAKEDESAKKKEEHEIVNRIGQGKNDSKKKAEDRLTKIKEEEWAKNRKEDLILKRKEQEETASKRKEEASDKGKEEEEEVVSFPLQCYLLMILAHMQFLLVAKA